jgi:predicted nucleotidyltransferase
LAHRAACALGDSPKNKRELFKQVREAYRIRSRLVHGKEAKLNKPGKNDVAALVEFANELEDLLRKAIKRKQDLAKRENVAVDQLNWDDFIF